MQHLMKEALLKSDISHTSSDVSKLFNHNHSEFSLLKHL